MKKVILSIAFLFFCLSNANAMLINIDWKTTGDQLLIKDTNTSLEWLKLSETNGRSYNNVSSQLGVGGNYEGFRYASNIEVIDLFTNYFFIDLREGSPHTPNNVIDTGIALAASTLGNIANEWNTEYPYGVVGIVDETHISVFDMKQYMGAMDALEKYGYNIYWDAVEHGIGLNHSETYIGSYLVKTNPIPEPTSVLLLGLGFIGAFLRRKRV